MDILLIIVWLVTAPILIWSRWNGPATIFNVALIVNALAGFMFMIKNWDYGK